MKASRLFATLGISLSLLVVGACTTTPATQAAREGSSSASLSVQHIRNATARIDYAGTTFLIDPMLAPKGSYPGFEGTVNSELRNPLTDLPSSIDQVLDGVDAVIVTHTHLDHWDDTAQQRIPKSLPMLVQHEADAKLLRSQGFKDVRVIDGQISFNGVTLTRTGGQHGTDTMYAVPQLAQLLGEAMGVVFQAPGQKTIYLAGDTIWRPEVDQVLTQYRPDVLILNTGYAQLVGMEGSLIMGRDDVARAYRMLPDARVIAVHMDAVNHATQSRQDLREYVRTNRMEDRVLIPADGETMKF